MAEEKPKKVGWFSKIRDRDDAVKVAKDCGAGFFVIAAIQGTIGVWIAPMLLIDAAIFAVCGFFIRRSFSRTAAIVALILGVITVVTTFMNKIGESAGGGNNIILALIILWAAIRSVEATFKLNGRYKDTAAVEQHDAMTGRGDR